MEAKNATFIVLLTIILQHNIKKIRNNISTSNISGKPRCLEIKGKKIVWKQFKEAYNWDQTNFTLPQHEHLSQQHFELDSATE